MTVRIPMKFSEADPSPEMVTAMIVDERTVMEQKHDGTRGLAVIRKEGRGHEPTVWWPGHGGRGALAHTAAIQWLPKINAELAGLLADFEHGEIVLDGEIMIQTGEYRVWDVPYAAVDGIVFTEPSDPFAKRRAVLEGLVDDGATVYLTRQAKTTNEKLVMYDAAREAGIEGVMIKRLDGQYESGQRVKHQLKLKFVKTADVVVLTVNRPDAKHGSAQLGVFVPTENGGVELIKVGACSLIGKPEVSVGQVIEVHYLYWTGEAIYQPRMVGIREDKLPEDCKPDQFATYSRLTI